MSFNGSGTFLINSTGQPVVANTVISATVFNALTADLASGLTNCITKDGQSTPTANIPMGSNKITGLANGTLASDAATLGQVQTTAAKLITSVSGVDTVTGIMSPTLTAYAAGQLFYFVAVGANTGAVTLNIDGLGAKAVTRDGASALAAGDINSGEMVVVIYDGTRFQMINAANSFGNTTINGTLTVTGNTGLQANVSITSTLSVGGTFAVTGAATLGSTLAVTGKSDLPTVSTASINAAVAVVTTGTVTNLTSTSASIASVNAGVALLTTATVTDLTATGASIASANIGNLQFTAASIASINAGVAVVTNLTATSASIASANVGTAVVTTGTVTNLSSTSASIASANAAVALVTTGTVTNLTSTAASIASANLGNAVATTLTATGASVASVNVGAAVLSGNLTLNGGTANGVLYLNGSKVATSGSAVTYDGTTFATTGAANFATSSGNVGIGTSTPNKSSSSRALTVNTGTAANYSAVEWASGDTLNYHINANNSAIYHVAAGTRPWIVYTNGSERMRIDSSGNVGIGFNNTGTYGKLGVSGTGYQAAAVASSDASGVITVLAANAASEARLNVVSNHPLAIYTNNTERMRIDSSGNVGIGTASPSGRLDVEGSSGVAYFNFSATAGGAASVFSLLGGTASEQAICFNLGALRFGTVTGKNAAGFTERMRIDTSGNVSIGGTAGFAGTRINLVGGFSTSGGFTLGFDANAQIPSGTTDSYYGYRSAPSTQAASFTLTNMQHFRAQANTIGAGSAVTNQVGFYAASDLTGATNNYGFYSDIASGSNRWNFYAAGTAQNYFAGNTGVGVAPASTITLRSQGSDSTSSNYALECTNSSNTTTFYVRNDGVILTGAAAASPYNNTTANAANMYVDNTGVLYRSTSSLRYKSDVADATHGLADVLKLRSVTYKGKNDSDTVFGGLIAEEVHDAGLTEFVAYDKEGRPDALHYGNMVALLVKAVQELKAELEALKAA